MHASCRSFKAWAKGKPTELSRSDVGPNDEGKVDFEYTARVPAGRYDAVRVVAWTVDGDAEAGSKVLVDPDAACKLTRGFSSEDTPSDTGKACVTVPVTRSSKAPGLEAQWADTKVDQLALHVTANSGAGKRVAVVVKRKKNSKGFYRFYRAILTPDAAGNLDTKFKVPVAAGTRRICVSAMYLTRDTKPMVRCQGSLGDFKARQAVVQLTRPAAKP